MVDAVLPRLTNLFGDVPPVTISITAAKNVEVAERARGDGYAGRFDRATRLFSNCCRAM